MRVERMRRKDNGKVGVVTGRTLGPPAPAGRQSYALSECAQLQSAILTRTLTSRTARVLSLSLAAHFGYFFALAFFFFLQQR